MTDDYEADEPAGALTTQPRRDNQIARQDFGGSSLATQNGAIEAMVAKSRAEVESTCILAKRWPRNPDQVRQDLIAECKRPGFARVAIYKVPRGDTKIEGLSIRFAEVAMRCSGNMGASSEIIYDDAAMRQIRVRVVDYERNSTWQTDVTVNKTVERKQLKRGQKPLGDRVNSYGERVFLVQATDDDVRTKQNAEVSKASRTGILRIIPGHLQDEARRICKEAAELDDKKDPAAARNRMFDAFIEIGVKATGLEQWLGHSCDTISPAEREELLGLHSAIKEGEITWAEALKDALADRDADSKPAAKHAEATRAVVVAEVKVEPAQPRQDTNPGDLARTAGRAGSSGKGTGALKAALGKSSAPGPTIVPRPQDDEEPTPMSDEEKAEYERVEREQNT